MPASRRPAATLAAQTAEVVFTVQQTSSRRRRSTPISRAARRATAGRRVRSRSCRACWRWSDAPRPRPRTNTRLQSLIHPELGVAYLSEMLGARSPTVPLDGPLPDVPLTNSQQGRQKVIVEMARSENPDHPPALQARGRPRAATARRCGTASDIVDSLEHWHASGAADGFNILALILPQGFADFAERGDARAAAPRPVPHRYEGRTLRENVGLPRPGNRFVARSVAAE